MKEKLCSKINEQNPRKVVESLYIFLITPDNCVHHHNIEILNLFDPELQVINTWTYYKKQIKRIVKWVEKV